MFISLDQPPSVHNPLFWADYSEIRALLHPDRCFSKGDLSGVAQRGKDIGRGFDANDKWRDILNFVNTRIHAYGDFYPFEISHDQDTISLKSLNSDRHNAYLALLIASSMRTLKKDRRNAVARVFEKFSYVIFEKLFPVGTELRATWAGAGTGAPYAGTLFQKLTFLAADLRCEPHFKKEDFEPNDTGDGSMDIVAWHPMADQRDGIPIAFAQCGCSKDDWEYKQIEAHTAKHRHRLPVRHGWANYYFMPLDFRRLDGDWAYKSDLGESIIVDRLRMLKLADQYGAMAALPALDYVTEARSFTYI